MLAPVPGKVIVSPESHQHLGQPTIGKQTFGNLHRIEGRPFANLVSTQPQIQTAGMGQILAYPPYQNRILS